MKRAVLYLALGCLSLGQSAIAKDFLSTQGHHIINERQEPVILRGMGLGGWMLQEGYMLELSNFGTQQVIRAEIEKLIGPQKTKDFYTAWLDNHTTKADIDAMKRWGFNSVRLPMHYNLYTLPVDQEPVKGENTWLEDGFRRTDQLIEWAKANDIYVILDLHAAPGGQGNDLNISDRDPTKPSFWDDMAHQDKAVALWVKLAERYKDEPYIAGYDLINEPNWGFTDPADKNGCKEKDNTPLRQFLTRATKAIREVDTKHIIFIEGNCWGNNYEGVFSNGVWDDNMVISFHKYWNHTTPDTLAGVLALRDQHNLPLWLGETGENSNDWFARTVHLAESHGIGWAWWPLKKIRYNNPLQIVPNEGYNRLLAYWQGKGEKPAPQEAEAALMQFATHDIHHDNNIYHPDVVDALFRAPHTDSTVPFKAHNIGPEGGSVRAADFDMGRNHHAYFDLTPANYHVSDGGERVTWNPAMTYRNDGVDLGIAQDGSVFVADMQAGEWLKFTLNAEADGAFDLTVDKSGGEVALYLNGQVLPDLTGVKLLKGSNTLIVKAETNGFDLYGIDFAPVR
ncbi:cellulase family glycosylhydrolase [Asticcacaulis tiandongensis]|uniref:cellulase family glycosylhydrolase n=1 Tax=Asticcacaulis tiandongensis TaxID=2565365 RepID=UPI00112B94D9|nr:cellulase family glycosylhydrolase [Asticcacaulis tiandongensis]